MPDISMCDNKDCPKAPQCYRNQMSGTQPNQWRQSYMDFKPDADGNCKDFVDRNVR